MPAHRPGQRAAQSAYRAGRQSSAAMGRAVRSAGGMSSKLIIKTSAGWAEITADDEGGEDFHAYRPNRNEE